MILTDEEALRIECTDVLPEEVDEIREKLEQELKASGERGRPGIGLAAPQIGIPKRMAIVRLDDCNIDLVNATIANGYDLQIFEGEGCLSFPNRTETTKRYNEIHILDNMVEPKKFVATGLLAVVCQHECLPYDSIIETEFGPEKIGDLVKNNKLCNVYSLDQNNNFILSKIIKLTKNKNIEEKKWVRLCISKNNRGPNKSLVCTEDHRCATIDNILFPSSVNFLSAINVKSKYIVRKPTFNCKNSEAPLYNSNQISCIIGGLLGDLCISKKGEIIISHGENQKEYANHKSILLNGEVTRGYSGYRNEYSNYVVKCQITEQTKFLRNAYKNGYKDPKFVIDYIDEIALAYWYMDDGTLLKRDCAQFHTESFNKKDVIYLSKVLKSKFKISSSVYKRVVRGVDRWILVLNKESSKILFELIKEYVISSMRYKLPEKFHCDSKRLNNNRLSFSVKKVHEIKEMKKESCLYDIEVDGTHNFVANNTVVHNCDHYRGILLPDVAIKKEEKGESKQKVKIRPNDKCPCGSNKKYKKCCKK